MKYEVKFVILLHSATSFLVKKWEFTYGWVDLSCRVVVVFLIFQSFIRLCCCVFCPTWSQTTLISSAVFMRAGWSPAHGRDSMEGPWPPASISQGILFVGRFQAEASPKDEGDFCLPKRGDNRRKNKDENLLSSQLNLFRLIPAHVIQTAAKPRFP